jgi:hypothetical protein
VLLSLLYAASPRNDCAPIVVLRLPLLPSKQLAGTTNPEVYSHCEARTGLNGCTGAMRRSNLLEKGRLAKKVFGVWVSRAMKDCGSGNSRSKNVCGGFMSLPRRSR